MVLQRLLATIVLLGALNAHTAVPHMIRYQARLTDDAGVPIAGLVDVTASIHDFDTAGAVLWSETLNGVSMTDGRLDIVLGRSVAIPPALFDGPGRWLELTVTPPAQGAITLAPRQELTSVPYAHSAERLDGKARTEIEVRFDGASRNTAAPASALQPAPPAGVRDNTAFGAFALAANTTGVANNAFGMGALMNNTGGVTNSAFGRFALENSVSGNENIAIGDFALRTTTTGSQNIAIGPATLGNATGDQCTAVGVRALQNITGGTHNTALGWQAGRNLTLNDSSNLMLGNEGVAGDSFTIRIGSTQSRTFVAGVREVTPASPDTRVVIIDANGQLGTVPAGASSSSITFLKDVESSGVNGQGGSVGSYAAVDLDVQEGDTSFCSLTGGQFTLEPGTYVIRGAVTFFKVGTQGTTTYSAKGRVWNVTDGAAALVGSSVWVAHDNFNYTDSANSVLKGILSVESETTFELQYRTSHINLHIGRAAGFGDDEVYSQVEIERVSDSGP